MRHLHTLLIPGEEIRFWGRLHPVLYASGVWYLFLAGLAAFLLPRAVDLFPVLEPIPQWVLYHAPWMEHFPQALTLLLFLRGSYTLLDAFFRIYFTEIAVTDRRVMAKFGIATVTTIEMDLDRIASVLVHQNIAGQSLGYGKIFLRGFSGNVTELPWVSQPEKVQRLLQAGRQ